MRQYQMILGDEDEAEYISSEDDDYAPPVPKVIKGIVLQISKGFSM